MKWTMYVEKYCFHQLIDIYLIQLVKIWAELLINAVLNVNSFQYTDVFWSAVLKRATSWTRAAPALFGQERQLTPLSPWLRRPCKELLNTIIKFLQTTYFRLAGAAFSYTTKLNHSIMLVFSCPQSCKTMPLYSNICNTIDSYNILLYKY